MEVVAASTCGGDSNALINLVCITVLLLLDEERWARDQDTVGRGALGVDLTT